MEPIATSAESESNVPVTQESTPETLSGGDTKYVKISNVFGLNPHDLSVRQTEALKKIWGWAKETAEPGATDDDLMWAVVSKRNQMGGPKVGTTYLEKFMTWLTAYSVYRSAESDMKKVEML